MKRHNNLYQQIISKENLQLADINARKGKSKQACIKKHDEKKEENISNLHYQLKNKIYKTSDYTTFTISDPKERLIYRLPYIDRVVHHAIMIPLEPIFVSTFTSDTYNCIKGRGVYAASNYLKKSLRDVEGTTYCLKIDIKKFYPSVNNDILKGLIRRKFKDKDLLWLLDGIIDSADGLPIGNLLSQTFSNFYLTYFDHWIKESQKVLYYMRYSDDMVFLSSSKQFLHKLLANIKEYLSSNLKLTLKSNYQVFLVKARGIDVLGYVFFHTHTLIRKRVKQKFARILKRLHLPNRASINSYLGLFKHGNCMNLINTLMYNGATS